MLLFFRACVLESSSFLFHLYSLLSWLLCVKVSVMFMCAVFFMFAALFSLLYYGIRRKCSRVVDLRLFISLANGAPATTMLESNSNSYCAARKFCNGNDGWRLNVFDSSCSALRADTSERASERVSERGREGRKKSSIWQITKRSHWKRAVATFSCNKFNR